MTETVTLQSWGRVNRANSSIFAPAWLTPDVARFIADHAEILPYGRGKSYGDVCLNDGNTAILTKHLNHILSFDKQRGIIRCEAGITLAELLAVCVPAGWFLPVTPGTKHVSLGGAIANDVHGKNHQGSGTLGCHLCCFELIRSDGIFFCSPSDNPNIFRATIGGLGLTGLISWAEIKLKPITSLFLDTETSAFNNLDQFFELAEEKDRLHEYTVAWIDCLTTPSSLGRGIFLAANHCETAMTGELPQHKTRNPRLSLPVNAPLSLSQVSGIKLFNNLYYRLKKSRSGKAVQHYDPYFYPLDGVGHWNRFYGANGFFQLQCVIPKQNRSLLREMLVEVGRANTGSFLSVLKMFGDRPSPGILSFPMPGYTLALDFPNRGQSTQRLLARLNAMVIEAGGRLYPAKDATMTAMMFQQSYASQLQEFVQWVDPHFTSGFWRRCFAGER